MTRTSPRTLPGRSRAARAATLLPRFPLDEPDRAALALERVHRVERRGGERLERGAPGPRSVARILEERHLRAEGRERRGVVGPIERAARVSVQDEHSGARVARAAGARQPRSVRRARATARARAAPRARAPARSSGRGSRAAAAGARTPRRAPRRRARRGRRGLRAVRARADASTAVRGTAASPVPLHVHLARLPRRVLAEALAPSRSVMSSTMPGFPQRKTCVSAAVGREPTRVRERAVRPERLHVPLRAAPRRGLGVGTADGRQVGEVRAEPPS